VADSSTATPSGVRAADTPGPGRARRVLLSLCVLPLLRWLAEVHAVPPGAPWRRHVPLRLRSGSVELLAVGLVAVGVVAEAPWAYFWWALVAAPLVYVDLAVHRLPDRLTVCAAIGVYVLLSLGGDLVAWRRAVLAGVVVGAGFALSTLLLGRRGFGFGDAKLALSCAGLLGWYGWATVLGGLMAAFVASGVVSLGLLATRRVRWSSHVPFGPFLVLGTVVALVW
jgi:leader peptidase (prepilin peptidase) / N-methyltransferase